jgi:hypothetical protein
MAQLCHIGKPLHHSAALLSAGGFENVRMNVVATLARWDARRAL